MDSYICKLEDNSVDKNESFILSNEEYNYELFKHPFKTEKNTLLILCVLSKLIYKYDDEHLTNVLLKNWGLEYEIHSIESGLVYGVFYTNEFLILSFKGTSTLKDVIHDVNFVQTDDDFNIPGKIHGGFENMILENNIACGIKNKINQIIKEKDINKNKIYVTGHSLGGALAGVFCCYYLTRKDQDMTIKPQLVTFGSPRSGDKDFSNIINESIRVVNGNDIITNVPIFYYKHFKKIYHIGGYFSFRFISDHHLSKYYIELMKIKE